MKANVPCQKKTSLCDGKDVRWVRPRRIYQGHNFFDLPKEAWCQGCRTVMNGGFKYVKHVKE